MYITCLLGWSWSRFPWKKFVAGYEKCRERPSGRDRGSHQAGPAQSQGPATQSTTPVAVARPVSLPISRDSSCAAGSSSGEGGPDVGRQTPEDESARSARKLRRKQMHQAKLTAEKAAKLAKTYNKTHRKAEEKKAIEEKTEMVLADDKTTTSSPDPSSDSEAERVQQRIEAAKRRAKVDAEQAAKKGTAKLTAGGAVLAAGVGTEKHPYGHAGGSGSREVFVPPQIRPATYPAQTEVIQQAFFKVEQKENGLMFGEMSRDECFQ